MFQGSKASSVAKPPKNSAVMAAQKQVNTGQRKSVFLNFIAGGVGGTAGVFVTCPLDVVQTRLQSSMATLHRGMSPQSLATVAATGSAAAGSSSSSAGRISMSANRFGLNVILYMKQIVQSEGIGALYKGLVPNLIGIAPSRSIYFAVYTKTKAFLSSTSLSNSSKTHMLSALTASWSTSTLTNPIWFLKTRLQLDTSAGKRKPLLHVIREVLRNEGIRGFYRGLSASYVGAAETMMYFVIYERLKMTLEDKKDNNEKLSALDYVAAAFFAKSLATVSVYPHEVARTRLRQEASMAYDQRKYRGFFQTLLTVYREERMAGLYGGMGAHLMRQVPNTVIMFLTYETIVNFFSSD